MLRDGPGAEDAVHETFLKLYLDILSLFCYSSIAPVSSHVKGAQQDIIDTVPYQHGG
jgi:hypothetical protein